MCNNKLEAATHAEEGYYEPRGGDLSICWNCGELLEYNDILVLHRLSPEKWLSFPVEERQRIQKLRQPIIDRGRIR